MVEVIVALPNLKAAPRIHARYPFLLPVGGSRRPSAANSSLATDEVANPTYAFVLRVLNANRTRAVALLLD